MLEMFEKLINEHGSSTILRERIELISDRYTILEEKLDDANLKNSALLDENESLNSQLGQASLEIEELRGIIQAAEDSQSSAKLAEAQEKLLTELFKANNPFTIPQIAHVIGAQESVAQYHVDLLKDKDLIDYGPLYMNAPPTYKLSKYGRAFVVEQIGI